MNDIKEDWCNIEDTAVANLGTAKQHSGAVSRYFSVGASIIADNAFYYGSRALHYGNVALKQLAGKNALSSCLDAVECYQQLKTNDSEAATSLENFLVDKLDMPLDAIVRVGVEAAAKHVVHKIPGLNNRLTNFVVAKCVKQLDLPAGPVITKKGIAKLAALGIAGNNAAGVNNFNRAGNWVNAEVSISRTSVLDDTDLNSYTGANIKPKTMQEINKAYIQAWFLKYSAEFLSAELEKALNNSIPDSLRNNFVKSVAFAAIVKAIAMGVKAQIATKNSTAVSADVQLKNAEILAKRLGENISIGKAVLGLASDAIRVDNVVVDKRLSTIAKVAIKKNFWDNDFGKLVELKDLYAKMELKLLGLQQEVNVLDTMLTSNLTLSKVQFATDLNAARAKFLGLQNSFATELKQFNRENIIDNTARKKTLLEKIKPMLNSVRSQVNDRLAAVATLATEGQVTRMQGNLNIINDYARVQVTNATKKPAVAILQP